MAAATIVSAFHQRANFYSAMVHLAQSNISLIVRPPITPFALVRRTRKRNSTDALPLSHPPTCCPI